MHINSATRVYVNAVETVYALDAVTLNARAGEFLCVFGHSGSGKSTLLNVIAGLDTPTSGEVTVCGMDVVVASEDERALLRRSDVGFVHQADFLIEEFTASENVALPIEANGVRWATAKPEADALLELVGLAGLGDRFPAELSGGQRQRVGIARGLAGNRSVLLADEPTGALDTTNALGIFDLFRQVANRGVLVIVASHDPRILEFATRSVEMLDGRIIGESAHATA